MSRRETTPPLPPGDTYEPTDIYQKLVLWYDARSDVFHWASLMAVFLLNGLELFWALRDPGGPGNSLKAPGGCLTPPKGYDHYTPIFWVVGLATGLVTLFVLRYAHPFNTEGKANRADRRIREAMLKPISQWIIIVASVGLLIVEFGGIAFFDFTISAIVRGLAIQHSWLYWVGGLLASYLSGLIIDLQGMPRLIRFMLVIWVAVLAHIFWWITPT